MKVDFSSGGSHLLISVEEDFHANQVRKRNSFDKYVLDHVFKYSTTTVTSAFITNDYQWVAEADIDGSISVGKLNGANQYPFTYDRTGLPLISHIAVCNNYEYMVIG